MFYLLFNVIVQLSLRLGMALNAKIVKLQIFANFNVKIAVRSSCSR